tara:strand:- start:114 stop:611 length:498 start_codon:yes stop_codon:yes gene_type:complete
MKSILNLLAVLVFAFSLPSIASAQEPLESLMEVFLVEQVQTDDGIEESLVQVDEAAPESILEYVLTYTNTSDQSLNGFIIKNPVPANTSYMADTASSPEGARFLVSIDHGATFESEPVVRIVEDENGNEREVTISPDQYNALEWIVEQPLEAGQQMSMRYRVIID